LGEVLVLIQVSGFCSPMVAIGGKREDTVHTPHVPNYTHIGQNCNL